MKSREFEHHGWIKQLIEQVKTPDFLVLLVSGTLMSLTFCVIGPLELYFSNANEFWFDIVDLVIYIVAFFLLTLAICIVTGLLVKRRRFICISLFFGTGLALYLQANFLNGNMGLLNGTEVDWCASWGKVILNSGIWIACIAVPILLYHFAKKSWHEMLVVISIIVIGMQTAAVVSLCISAPRNEKNFHMITDEMFTLSKDENIIVFVLDTMDARFFEDYIMNDPRYTDQFKDFTFFNDTVSGGAPTAYGMPLLLTGTYYEGKPYEEYIDTAYENVNLYKKLKKNNYDVRLYTENKYVSESTLMQYIDNASDAIELTIDFPLGLARQLYRLVGYKYFPILIKNKFSVDSESFNKFQGESERNPYLIDDANFIQKFRKKGITIQDYQKAFRLYHMFGAHPYFTLDENGHYNKKGTSLEEQIHGVFNLLCEYIDELKKENIYENSTILVLADHGAYDLFQNPMLMIKNRGKVQEELKINCAPISFQNILPTLSIAIDGNNDEQGESIFDISENEERTRYQVSGPLILRGSWGGNWNYPVLFTVGTPARDVSKIEFMGVAGIPVYQIGEELNFSENGVGINTLFGGFSLQEKMGIWSCKTEACQKFQFAELPEKNLQIDIELNTIFDSAQQVTISFNDVLVYSQIQTDNKISFIVPLESITEGTQKISYQLSTAVPSKTSDSPDMRDLSINLLSMSMKETDASAQIVNCINAYSIGQKISFVDHEGKKYFMSGLSTVQGTDYSWSLGQTGKIVLDVGSFQGDLIGEFGLKYVYDSSQRLVIRHNEQILYDEVVMSASGPIRFLVPSDCIEEGKLILDLEYPDAVSPKSQGVSEDARKLALAFTSMQFSAEIPVYQIGEELNFSENGVGINTLFGGFSLQEKMGIWSCKTEACQKFQFAELPEKNLQIDIELNTIFDSAQQVTISFNDVLVYSQIQTDNKISFIVPLESITEGTQKISYQLSTAVPSKTSDSPDMRDLSINLLSMSMKETDASAQIVNCINAYSIGQKISFVDHEGKKYFMSGLSTVQGTDYSWSLGQTGKIVLDVGSFQGDLIGEFGLKYVYDSSQRLVIRHNEQILYDEVVMSASGPIRFLVPSDCIEEGKLILDLEYPDAVSPKSQGVSEDARKLALAFTSMQFSEES